MHFADLHCHPAVRPWHNDAGTMWEAYSYKPGKKRKLKKVLEAQRRGKRGSIYDQAGMPKLQNGGTRLAFASIYPLEKGFLLKKHLVQTDPLPGTVLRNYTNETRTVLLRLFTKYPIKALERMAGEEYWESFKDEYQYYLKENNAVPTIGPGSKQEITELISRPEFRLDGLLNYTPTGSFILADKHNPPDSIAEDKVITILTMEGIGIIAQTSQEDGRLFPLRLVEEQTLFERIKFIKKRTPIFFITFCHHFDNGLCGHARSIPLKAKLVGLNQEDRINEGFNTIGHKVLSNLLSIKQSTTGDWTDDTAAGRRIYIDMKHMSLAGRLELIEIVKNYNSHNSKKIPLIASHNGFSGTNVLTMQHRLRPDAPKELKERDKTQVFTRHSPHFSRPIHFNGWSINLTTEEIRAIVASDGLIGLSLEQNILGVKFGDKLKSWEQEDFTHLIVSHLCVMAQAAETPVFWKHVAIGSDFDGLINPVDGYPGVLFFERLRLDMIEMFMTLSHEARVSFHLPDQQSGKEGIVRIVDDFCFYNAMKFVEKYFDHNSMPAITPVSA